MKKVLLSLTTLLLVSCVNLDEPKVQKVENNTKNVTTKTNKPFFIIPLPFLFEIVR